ncbi:hypothetical protein BWD08_10545 [Neisseria animaloris]|nr:hypothetical protein BWD08_10545 [Neisseria animaloris]
MIGALPTIKKYWQTIAVLIVVALLAWFWFDGNQAAYQKGYNDATAKISLEIAESVKKNAEKAHESSAEYQDTRAEQVEKERVRYVKVKQIIKQPVYVNRCFDDVGMQVVNDSADEYQPAAR